MNPENPGINSQKSERTEESEPKLILPTAEEIMSQVEGGLDERATQEGDMEKEHLQATIDQIGIEQQELKGGVFSKFSDKVRKAALVGFAGLSLFAASGSFSNAEAGDKSFAQKIFKQVESGVIRQVGGGFQRMEQDANMQQRMEWQREQQRANLEFQRQSQVERREWQRQDRVEQMAIRKIEQRERARERAIQKEVDRYMKAIANAEPEDLKAEEAKHNAIMKVLSEDLPSR